MLTAKKEKMILGIFNGLSSSDAYKQAYNTGNMLPATISNNAYKLMQSNDVVTRLKELREPLEASRVINVTKILSILEKIAESAPKDTDRIAASDKILKAAGAYRNERQEAPVQVTHVTVILASETRTVEGEVIDV